MPHPKRHRVKRSSCARRSLKSHMDTAAPRKRPAPAVTRRKKRDARPVCKKRGTARCGKRHRTATETPAANSDSPKSGQREATNVGSPQRGEMPGKAPAMGRKPKRLEGVLACYGRALQGEVWPGEARPGAAWQGKGCSQRPADSLSRLSGGNTNEAVHAMAGPGRDRLGAAWRGKARPGTARRGTAWRGKAWRGKGWIQRIGLCKEPLPVRLAPSTF